MEEIFKTKSTISEIKLKDSKNLCPYKIPTIDEIINQIDALGYRLNKSKLILTFIIAKRKSNYPIYNYRIV